jgi:hypothetical protein
MTEHELVKAKDPDLRSSLNAIKRAAGAARKIAIQTDTCIVIVRDNKMVHVTAQELRREQQA